MTRLPPFFNPLLTYLSVTYLESSTIINLEPCLPVPTPKRFYRSNFTPRCLGPTTRYHLLAVMKKRQTSRPRPKISTSTVTVLFIGFVVCQLLTLIE